MKPGAIFAEHYRVLSQLGVGGMGEVYLVENIRLGRREALKLLHTTGDDEAVARFEREARTAARLGHPSIADIYHYGTTDSGRPWFTMVYVEGTDLTNDNFVSFEYDGSNLMLPYLVLADMFPVRVGASASPSVPTHGFYSMTGNLTNGGDQWLALGFGDGLEFTLGIEGNWFTCGTNGNGYYEVPCSWMNNNDYGSQGSLSRVVNPVPAPPVAALLGVGMGVFGIVRRRRTR